MMRYSTPSVLSLLLVIGIYGLLAACGEPSPSDLSPIDPVASESQALSPGWQAAWGEPALSTQVRGDGGRSPFRSVCGAIGASEWDSRAWEVERIETYCDGIYALSPRSFVRLVRHDDDSEVWLTTGGGICPDETEISSRFSVELGDRVFVALDDEVTWSEEFGAHAIHARSVIVQEEEEAYRIGSRWMRGHSFDEIAELGTYPDSREECPVVYAERPPREWEPHPHPPNLIHSPMDDEYDDDEE